VRIIQRNEDIYRALYGTDVSDRTDLPVRQPSPDAPSQPDDQQM